MSDMITAEKAGKLPDDPFKNPGHLANAADAMGRACENWQSSTARYHFACRDTIRALMAQLADPSGVEALAALRAERDQSLDDRTKALDLVAETITRARNAEADRDRLAAANAALEAQVARLVGAVKEYHLALDRRQNGDTAGYRLQDEIQRILDMPWRQGAALAEVQADARREGGE